MAFYILIDKQYENEFIVVYNFSDRRNQLGQLQLNKNNGEIIQLRSLNNDKSKAYFMRTSAKIRQHWKQGRFPKKTCWAS